MNGMSCLRANGASKPTVSQPLKKSCSELRVWGVSATLGNVQEAAKALVGPDRPPPEVVRGTAEKTISGMSSARKSGTPRLVGSHRGAAGPSGVGADPPSHQHHHLHQHQGPSRDLVPGGSVAGLAH